MQDSISLLRQDEHLNAMTKFIPTGLAIERLQHKEDMIRSQITANEAVQSNYC